MKRVYKNNDITFNLSINKFPFDSDIIKGIDFKFFTKNEKNCIRKTKEDIVNGSLILEWKELANLEEGIMYYTYNVSVTDSSFSDNENNTVDKVITDYFIMSGKTGIDCKQDGAVWGLIEGDVANLKDLVAYIDLTIKNLNKTYYNKNEIDIKESLLKQETATKQEQLISGTNIKTINGESILGHTDIKVATQGDIDKTNILIKQVAQTKANKSYVEELEQTKADKILVDELVTDKLDKNDAVGKHYTAGVVKLGEVFNYDGNVAKGSKSHAENGGYGDIFVTGENVPSPLRRSIIGNNTPLKVMSCKVYIPTQSSSRENIDVIIRIMNASSKAIRESWSRPAGTYDILNINVSRMGEAIYQPLNTNLNTYEEGDYLVFDYGYLGEDEYARQQALQFYNALMNVWVENEIISFEFINFADYVSNETSGECSHAEGVGTITNNLAEHAEGKYNNSSPNTISSVGIGENNGYRKNAVEIMKDGKAYFLDLGGYNGRINPLSKSIQEVVNAKADKEYITTLENRLKAVEDTLNSMHFISLEDVVTPE